MHNVLKNQVFITSRLAAWVFEIHFVAKCGGATGTATGTKSEGCDATAPS